MGMAYQLAAGVVIGLLVTWLVLVTVLFLGSRRFGRPRLGELLRLLPDVLRLLRRLAADQALPAGVRVRLWLLLAYLLLPIDLIPDFIPVVGYADDAIIVAFALRAVARRAGVDALALHWPGTDAGLAAVLRASGVGGRPERGAGPDA